MDIFNRVNILIKKAYYTYERFDVDATFALLYHDKPLDIMDVSKHVRLSDQLMQIDEHHYFIIFTFTPQDNAYKASQNLLMNLDGHFSDQASFIALDSFDPSKSPQSVLNRLQLIMAEARKNPYVRIETEDILDR